MAGSGSSGVAVATAPAVAPVEPSPRRDGHLRYRPYLDGVRTLAVYLVVAFHAHLGAFTGGFIGVDVFFVLSGYLVTSILVRYLAQFGRVQWSTFYSRRVRRILPAAIVTLCVTAVAYAVVATPSNMLDALGGFRATCFYVANWFFIRQSTDYFAANVNSSPVLHFWSLAVEEQFYIVWPLVLGAVYAVAGLAPRWRWWVLRGFALAAATASLVMALHLYSSDPSRAYYGTDTRAYQLLAGALLALTPQLFRLRRNLPSGVLRAAAGVAVGIIVLLATSVVDVSPVSRGILVAIFACVMIVALENTNGGVLKGALSNERVTYLGRISYATYLWHWPVIVLLTYHRSVAPIKVFVIACVVATSLAAVSFRVLENPIRVSDVLSRYKRLVIPVGLMISVLVGALFMPIVLDPGNGKWLQARNDIPPVPSCVDKPIEKCIVVHGGGRRIILVGDSTARMWIPALTEIAKRESLTLAVAVMTGCSWQHGLQYALEAPRLAERCRTVQDDWYNRIIPKFDPGIVVLVHRDLDGTARAGTDKYVGPRGDHFQWGDANFEQELIDVSRASLARLRHPGRQLVIIEPTPESPGGFDPLNCLSDGRAPQNCRYRTRVQPTPLERVYRAAAKAPDVTALDMDRIICPGLPICPPILHDDIVTRDGRHLTATFAHSIWADLDRMLHNRQLLR
jgi:peptidoglycan/LPS O-acetylase OafA/YrhL